VAPASDESINIRPYIQALISTRGGPRAGSRSSGDWDGRQMQRVAFRRFARDTVCVPCHYSVIGPK
jgi:hypothetical protein